MSGVIIMTVIEIKISEDLSAALDRAIAASRDLSAPLGAIANFGRNATLDNFTGEHDPDGKPWIITFRKRANPFKKILVESGDLIGSIIALFDAKSATWGSEASGAAAIIANVHQFGARITAKAGKALNTPFGLFAAVNIPARPFVGFNANQQDHALKVISSHFESAFQGGAA